MLFIIRNARVAVIACLTILSTPLVAEPLLYEIDSPLYGDAPHKVTIYQQDDFAVGVHNPADRPALREAENGPPRLVGQGPAFAAAAALPGRLLKGQRLSRWYFRIPEPGALEIGKRYSETIDPPDPRKEPFQRQWWIDNLDVVWREGDDDRQVAGLAADHVIVQITYDYYWQDAGEESPEHDRVESRRDFWFTGAHRFSPLQLLPHRNLNDSRFVYFGRRGASRVNQHVYQKLLPRLREAGMLVRTKVDVGTDQDVIALQSLEQNREIDIERYRDWPRIPESREDGSVGALMMSEMVGGARSNDPASELQLPTGTDYRTLPATASFQVTDRGDSAVALSFETESGGDGLLLLLRAHHGRPAPGDYASGPILDRHAMQAMSTEALLAYAEDFQAYGVFEDSEGNVTTYTSAGEGTVSVTASEQKRITGEFDIEAEAVELYGAGAAETRRIRGQFDASRPLEGRMMSPVSQILRMNAR
ncbi:MAG: hypothetical protein ABR550_12515 [Wenzhouxiangellaceae bacterium]